MRPVQFVIIAEESTVNTSSIFSVACKYQCNVIFGYRFMLSQNAILSYLNAMAEGENFDLLSLQSTGNRENRSDEMKMVSHTPH